MLDRYITQLTQDDEMQKTASSHLDSLSVEELAKMAGITFPENICTMCLGEMQKLGSIFRCKCGMMKKAGVLSKVKDIATKLGVRDKALKATQLGKLTGAEKTRVGKLGREAFDKALTKVKKGGVEKKAMSKCGECGMEKHETEDGVKCGCGVKIAFSVTEEGHGFDAEQARIRAAAGADEMEQSQRYDAMGSAEGPGSFLKAFRGFVPGRSADPRYQEYVARQHEAGENAYNPFGGMLTPSSRETGGTSMMFGKFKKREPEVHQGAGLPTAGESAEGSEKAASEKLTKLQPHPSMAKDKDAPFGYLAHADGWHEGKAPSGKPSIEKEAGVALLAKALGKVAPSVLRAGKGVATAGRLAKGGETAMAGKALGGAAKTLGKNAPAQWVKSNPLKAAGGAAAGGYAMGKMGSVDEEIIRVGEAAGKTLAKTAFDNTPIPIDELRESLEEAKGREDIQGRGRRWQIGSGIGAGAAAGAGGAALGRKLLGTPGMIGGGLLGMAAGGTGGAMLGKAHGQEEARADKALSMLRAMKAHRAGAGHGFQAGIQRGYGMGQQGQGE